MTNMQKALQEQSEAHQAYIKALTDETSAKQIVIHSRQKYLMAKRQVEEMHNDEVLACERNINLK